MFLYAELSTVEIASIFRNVIDVVRSTAPCLALPSTAEREAPSIAKQQYSYNRVCKFC